MEVLNLFPTELFVFENSKIDNEFLIKQTQILDNVSMKQSTTISILYDLRTHKEFNELFAWFDQCLEQVRVAQKYDCESFEITNSWFNVALSGYNMYQNYHRHSMSFFSGVYYMTEGSATVFEDPVLHRTQAQIEVLRHDYVPLYESIPKPGKLVIFPSWMYHRSLPHIGHKDRYIISFNSMPVGKINHNLATDSKATLKVLNG